MNYSYPQDEQGIRFDGLSIVALLFLFFMAFNIFRDRDHPGSGPVLNLSRVSSFSLPANSEGASGLQAGQTTSQADGETGVLSAAVFSSSGEALAYPPYIPEAFAAPYLDYVITQGLHGYSYGHMAIDIAAGKGAEILAVISGYVTENSVDRYGNTTLVIENEVFRVTYLHGDYVQDIDAWVDIGDLVGYESNHGYTTDMQGRPCAGRDCGYHTHLNVFDLRQNQNVNPLNLIEQ